MPYYHDFVIADLDFVPYFRCAELEDHPHAATHAVYLSCGCVELWCDELFITLVKALEDRCIPCLTCDAWMYVESGRPI